MTDKTMTFKIGNENDDIMKETLTQVFDALQEKGYNPINQIRRIDRDELLAEMVKSYLS